MEMSPKERWLAAIRMEPVDRLPFWPKLDAAYPRAQSEPFDAMKIDAIHDWIGSDKHTGLGSCLRETRTNTSVQVSQENGLQTTRFVTPHGELRLVKRFDPASQSWHPVQFPVSTVEDVKLMAEWVADGTAELNEDALEAAKAAADAIGDDAVTATTIGESPLMYWVEWVAGVQNAHLLLSDYPDQVEELFRCLHDDRVRRTQIVAQTSPADVLYFSENTSTTLISPEQYRKYCLGHITDYGNAARAEGRLMILHMCGHLKDLLGDLCKLPVDAFEAFTSPTLGNTTLLDGRTGCPDKCIVGGTNAMLWTRPASTITAQIEQDLDALPHHRGIVVTSAGVMPPLCTPETIREVCAWVKQYPVSN